MYEITILELDENDHGIGSHKHHFHPECTLANIEKSLLKKYNRFLFVSMKGRYGVLKLGNSARKS